IDEQEVKDGAWAIAEESSINVLSDKELTAAISFLQYEDSEPTAESVVGALFANVEQGGTVYSFDIVVDPTFQRKGIGTRLMRFAMQEARGNDCERVELVVVSEVMRRMVLDYGFYMDPETNLFRYDLD